MRCLRYTRGAAGRVSALAAASGRVSALAAAAAWALALPGCASAYRHLRPALGDPTCIQHFKPALGTAIYKTSVDIIGKHLDGLLVLKAMPDSSTRVVFTSEAGPTFFDFGFARDGHFTVYHIIDQMNKKAVIKGLRKDFELILLEHTARGTCLTDGTQRYYAFPQEKGVNYYITDSACTRLDRVEKASKRSAFVIARLLDYRDGIPDSISIRHTKFEFTIAFKRLRN